MFILVFIFEVLFCSVCSWVGYIVVKILTLGKLELDYGDAPGGMISGLLGLGFLVSIMLLISSIID